TLVHAVLERLFDAPAAQRTPRRAKSLIAGQWDRLRRSRPELAELFADAGEPDAAAPAGTGALEAPGKPPSAVTAEPAEPAEPAEAAQDAAGAALARWLDEVGELVERWFTLEDPTRLEPAERELFVEARLDSGLRLRGIIDRVDVAPTGE